MRHILKGLVTLLILGLMTGPVFAMSLAAPHSLSVHGAAGSGSGLADAVVQTLSLGALVVGITIRKDIGAIANKFVTRAGAAQGDYKDGVSNAGQSWESGATNAEAAWEGGTQAAITNKRFAKGVTGKASKYQTNAVNLGSQRYGPGVANAKDAYAKGMAPVIAALSSLSLPPGSFRGSPQNQARANTVATALAALRANR